MEISTSFFWTIGLFFIVYGPLSGTVRFWDSTAESLVLVPAGSWVTVIGCLLTASSYLCFTLQQSRTHSRTFIRYLHVPPIDVRGLVAAFLVLFLTDWIARPYSLVKGPEIRGEIFLFSLFIFWSLTKATEVLFFRCALIAGCVILSLCFYDAAVGRFLFSDDHSVTVYRLSLLKEHFPFIPFYNPFWNMGLDARDFFATGILNLFTLWSPLIYLFEVRSIYNIIIAGTLFGVGPLMLWLSARLEQYEEPIPSIAALLSLATSLFWYRWGLKYGSMGFVTATLFVPFNLVFLKRIFFSEDVRPWMWWFAIASMSWMLCWSLTTVIFVPTAVVMILNSRSIFVQKKIRRLFLWLVAINLPWMLLFLSVSKVQTFVNLHSQITPSNGIQIDTDDKAVIDAKAKVKGKVKKLTPSLLLEHARDVATPTNVVLMVFGFFGIFIFASQRTRWFYIAQTAWLLVVGFLIAPFFPQLELDRVLIVLGFILCLPASLALNQAVQTLRKNRGGRWLVSLPLSYGVVGIFSVGSILYNRTLEKINFVDSVYYDLSKTIRENAHGGRAVFAGFVLHELNQGHLAPLMQEARVPMVASTLFHNLWRYTDLMPSEYLEKGEQGFEEYFDLTNATEVVTHEKKWRSYFVEHPEIYTLVGTHGDFQVFSRKHTSNYFLEGSGAVVNQRSNAVELQLTTPDAVVLFQYYPFLHASAGCAVEPRELPGNLKFIKLSHCDTDKTVVITAHSGFWRLFHGS